MTRQRYLLDTNAISATRQPRKHPDVVRFLGNIPESNRFLSVLTLGELRRGLIVKAKKSQDGVSALRQWIEDIELAYGSRTLTVTIEIAKLWGEYSADRSRDQVDALLAATAVTHNMILVTRNVRDFDDLPVRLHDPWAV